MNKQEINEFIEKMKEYQERELKNVMIQMIENLNFFRDMVGWLMIQRLEHIVLNLNLRKSKVTNEDVIISNVNYQVYSSKIALN